MILGYAIIAVPTGIVTVALGKEKDKQSLLACTTCQETGHAHDAIHCKFCGQKLLHEEED